MAVRNIFCSALSIRGMAAAAMLGFLAFSAPAAATTDVCRAYTLAAEQRSGIPDGLLGAIALAETGRWNEAAGESRAWPWTVMARGKGTYHPSKHAALAHVAQLRAEGVTNIDVGCMQVNLGYHGHRFASVADAIDPARNVAYAAQFLIEKHAQAESWIEAASHYHSMTPHLAARYRAKVERLWAGLSDPAAPNATPRDVTWGASVAAADAAAQPAYVQPSTTVNHALMDRLNQSFRARRTARESGAAVGTIGTGASGASSQVLAWRQARAADGTGAPVIHDLYGQQGGGDEAAVSGLTSSAATEGPMASLNAANAAQIAALIRRTEAQARERAELRVTKRSADSFANRRRSDLAHWRSRYGLDG